MTRAKRAFRECGLHHKNKTYCGYLTYLISGNQTELLFLAKIDCIKPLQFSPSYKRTSMIFNIAENYAAAKKYTKETSLTNASATTIHIN